MANLGVYSTQRAESMNAVLKKTLNRQISLLEACRRLVKVVESFEAKLLEAETMSMTYRARILDMNGFATILGKVTSYAIGLMAPEWAAACVPRPDSIWRGSCLHNCSFPLRYGLPCRHWMTRSVLEGFPLPISLVHPCWWLSGSPVLGGGWVMGYHNAAIDPQERWVGGFRNRGKDIVMESVQHLLKHQSQLLPEQSEHLMRRMVNNNNQILAEIHALKARDEEIPSELPPPLPSNLSLQARKQKGSTRKRALTGAEASERQQKAMTRAQTRARAAREVQSTQEGVAVTFKRRTRSQKDADLLEDQLQKDTANRVRLSELDVLIRLPGDRPSPDPANANANPSNANPSYPPSDIPCSQLLRALAVRAEGDQQREAAYIQRIAELEDELRKEKAVRQRAEERYDERIWELGGEAERRRERERSVREGREEEDRKRKEEVKGKGGEEEGAEGSKGGLLRSVRRRQQKSDLEMGK
ncbi:MAG: hypothetical protein M1840_002183 [Geoglossum simile]|nr:MAG: hypothetical protein M1840_002183 [Geoglossum simile]